MSKFVIVAVLLSLLALSCEKPLTQEEIRHLAWCDSISHQNVGCPLHRNFDMPGAESKPLEVEQLKWCDCIYQQSLDCPQHGEIEIPVEVLKQPAEELAKQCLDVFAHYRGYPILKR